MDMVHLNATANKKYTRKRHWEGVAVQHRKNLGARGGSPSGGAAEPRQQEYRSKHSTEVKGEWEKIAGVMKEETRPSRCKLLAIDIGLY